MSVFRAIPSLKAPLIRANQISFQNVKSFSTSRVIMAGISDVVKHDHREIEEYYRNIVDANDDDTKTRWQNQFTWELARHSIGEELVVYPAMEEYLGDKGKDMAEKDRQEHQVVRDKLYAFQKLTPKSPDFLLTLESLMEDLSKHIKEEESDDLPALEKVLSVDASDHMAKSFRRTKKFVPSRSHPMAPQRPPFETVVSLMQAPIDRLADMFRKFPDDDDKPQPRADHDDHKRR